MKNQNQKKKKKFLKINNLCLKDKTISASAKGVFAYLMSLPKGSSISKDQMYKSFNDDKPQILDKALKELQEKGYITLDFFAEGENK